MCPPDSERSKAHFFVYCSSPCKEMKQGKLRVRCASCRSGAFTVDRDPTSWEDVLKKHQIQGTCENGNDVCDFLFSFFRFKAICSKGHTQFFPRSLMEMVPLC